METLRLYPPISGLNKVSLRNGTVLSGYFIPAGTLISVSHHIERGIGVDLIVHT